MNKIETPEDRQIMTSHRLAGLLLSQTVRIYPSGSKEVLPAYSIESAEELIDSCFAALRADEWQKAAGWMSVKERLPESGKFVLAHFIRKNQAGEYPTTIRAFYAAPRDIEQSDDDDFGEYDEFSDKYFLPEGWYECNEEEEVHYFVHENITHWMPLPEPPTPIKEVK